MSEETTYRCDGCGKKQPAAGQFHVLPEGWRYHGTQAAPGTARHACSAGCMVGVLRADAAALEEQEKKRKAEEAAHAEAAEAKRVGDLEAHARALAAAEKRFEDFDREMTARAEELRRPGTGR
jgi:hypothetical protein